jgi:hypothetical protein
MQGYFSKFAMEFALPAIDPAMKGAWDGRLLRPDAWNAGSNRAGEALFRLPGASSAQFPSP